MVPTSLFRFNSSCYMDENGGEMLESPVWHEALKRYFAKRSGCPTESEQIWLTCCWERSSPKLNRAWSQPGQKRSHDGLRSSTPGSWKPYRGRSCEMS